MYSSSEKLCTNPKSGVPRRTSSSFKKLQRRGVCSSLVATRITTNYERQPRSTNPYGHEQCCVHEVKLRPSSCRYKYHLLTLHTSPTHQELILLSKTVILTTHGRGAVAVISKNVNSDLMRPQKVKSLPNMVRNLGMSSSKRPQTTTSPVFPLGHVLRHTQQMERMSFPYCYQNHYTQDHDQNERVNRSWMLLLPMQRS